jgi:hypothetical protein
MQERFTTLDPPAELMADYNFDDTAPASPQSIVNSSNSNSMTILPVLAIISFGLVSLCLIKKSRWQRSRALKIGGVLLCVLITSSLLLFSIGTVSADSAYIWGSRSTGGYDTRIDATWRKTSTELQQQQYIASVIANYFSTYGYNSNNFQGSNSLKAAIIGNISYSQTNTIDTAVVDFDHGVGNTVNGYWHYRFEDDIGVLIGNYAVGLPEVSPPQNAVYDYEVHSSTGGSASASKVFFALINTCLSANTTNQGQHDGSVFGMPYAFTHKLVLSTNDPNFNVAYHMSA